MHVTWVNANVRPGPGASPSGFAAALARLVAAADADDAAALGTHARGLYAVDPGEVTGDGLLLGIERVIGFVLAREAAGRPPAAPGAGARAPAAGRAPPCRAASPACWHGSARGAAAALGNVAHAARRYHAELGTTMPWRAGHFEAGAFRDRGALAYVRAPFVADGDKHDLLAKLAGALYATVQVIAFEDHLLDAPDDCPGSVAVWALSNAGNALCGLVAHGPGYVGAIPPATWRTLERLLRAAAARGRSDFEAFFRDVEACAGCDEVRVLAPHLVAGQQAVRALAAVAAGAAGATGGADARDGLRHAAAAYERLFALDRPSPLDAALAGVEHVDDFVTPAGVGAGERWPASVPECEAVARRITLHALSGGRTPEVVRTENARWLVGRCARPDAGTTALVVQLPFEGDMGGHTFAESPVLSAAHREDPLLTWLLLPSTNADAALGGHFGGHWSSLRAALPGLVADAAELGRGDRRRRLLRSVAIAGTAAAASEAAAVLWPDLPTGAAAAAAASLGQLATLLSDRAGDAAG